MEPLETESLFPDGETVRKVRIALERDELGMLLHVKVLEGPPLGDLPEFVLADADVNPAGLINPAWEEYIAHKWRFFHPSNQN